jgi:hypothetical protein
MITLLSLVLSLIFISSCGPAKKGGEQLALDIRTSFLKAEKIDLTADVTADYGERIYRFTFTYTGGADKGEITVTAPKELAGLKAGVSVSGGTISYDGAELDTGPLAATACPPRKPSPF